MNTSPWDPSLYLRFGDERTRPAADLVARIDLAAPRRVIDLGCGPGNSTAVLRARWPAAEVTGLDGDPAMLAAAEQSDPGVRWVWGDAAVWPTHPAERFDVVFANALLHWLPDHTALVPRLFGAISPGGALAVQVPAHRRSALHRLLWEVAREPDWRDRTAAARKAFTVHPAEFYYDLLAPLAARVDVWETEYQHVMDGPAAVLAWVRGTALRPFLEALPTDKHRARFEAALLLRIAAAFPRRADGKVLLPFPRLFVVATRGAEVGAGAASATAADVYSS